MDFNMNHEVNCSTMNIQDIKLNVWSYYEIVDVKFDNITLDWQLTPNTPYSMWLWILGVDYTQSDLSLYNPVPVTVSVEHSSCMSGVWCCFSCHACYRLWQNACLAGYSQGRQPTSD
jgi:hypothetical protein